MKAIELLDKLRAKAVFKIQDIERIGYCKGIYAKLILNRLKQRGLVKKIKRNAYTTKDSIFLIASNIVYPSYISFWSASYFLGYTEQILNTVQVATTRRAVPIKFEGYDIKFVSIKPVFGYKKIRTDEGDIFIAEDEKLLIDCFLRPKECGNFDEIIKIFENAKIDEDKVVKYLQITGNNNVIKRVGYLLETIKSVDISHNFILDKNYVVLNPFSKKWEKTYSKWRLKI
ncbi:MAG: hypothetical protein HY362_03860 [Candidatus Aenigmarchaeota archaeon]|nr:hypothetical protein [Candidatus Aenigmarchaeota archaeon]